jgi:hypothetical protein
MSSPIISFLSCTTSKDVSGTISLP